MTLHPLAERFAEVSEAYERGRPEYAPAVVAAIAAGLGIAPADPVLDLAAGTGKLTRALLTAGLDVVAVEPQAALREPLAAGVGAERVMEGLAEKIPLSDGSVAAVTVADAFHWFDQDAALAEIRRVLRPGGGLAIVSAIPNWSGASWAVEVGAVMEGLRPEHPHFDGPPWQEAVRRGGGWSEPHVTRLTSMQPASPEIFLDYITSVSWVAAMPLAERTEKLARIAAIMRGGDTPRELPVTAVIGLTKLL